MGLKHVMGSVLPLTQHTDYSSSGQLSVTHFLTPMNYNPSLERDVRIAQILIAPLAGFSKHVRSMYHLHFLTSWGMNVNLKSSPCLLCVVGIHRASCSLQESIFHETLFHPCFHWIWSLYFPTIGCDFQSSHEEVSMMPCGRCIKTAIFDALELHSAALGWCSSILELIPSVSCCRLKSLIYLVLVVHLETFFKWF